MNYAFHMVTCDSVYEFYDLYWNAFPESVKCLRLNPSGFYLVIVPVGIR